jgi:hypothetical protein
MSSLPFISHHLFVEAVNGNHQRSRKRTQEDQSAITLKGIATTLPLELLEVVRPMPSCAASEMRTSIAASES